MCEMWENGGVRCGRNGVFEMWEKSMCEIWEKSVCEMWGKRKCCGGREAKALTWFTLPESRWLHIALSCARPMVPPSKSLPLRSTWLSCIGTAPDCWLLSDHVLMAVSS